MKIQYAAISRTGKRSKNEDAFYIIENQSNAHWLGIVCDGMGGHAFGEVASETITQSISAYWQEHDKEKDSEDKVKNACLSAYKALNKRADSLSHAEIGTTMVMVSLEGNQATIAHLGDSRCYLLRPQEGVVYQTKDHISLSFGWEIISRSFFSYSLETPVPEVVQFTVEDGDRLLLCSDGLYKSITPDLLLARMTDDKQPDELLEIFDFICEKQSNDNYTAILIFIGQ